MSGLGSHSFEDLERHSEDPMRATRELIHFFESRDDPRLTHFIARLSKFYKRTLHFFPKTAKRMKIMEPRYYDTSEDLSSAHKTVDYFIHILLESKAWGEKHGVNAFGDLISPLSAWIKCYERKLQKRPGFMIHDSNPQMFLHNDEADESVSGESDSDESDHHKKKTRHSELPKLSHGPISARRHMDFEDENAKVKRAKQEQINRDIEHHLAYMDAGMRLMQQYNRR
jgi:hypothetical protein